ncbi:MAG: BtaA family protein [Chitinophagales bacterium]|nr:BtaA family protein [Chitinophagales bacterium]
MKRTDQIRDWVFQRVHGNNLVYNTCWEDPRCDRELMEFNDESEIVMITSAGCNALDYLIDQPASVNCIDVNPRQNALLQLKLAFFKYAGFEDLFEAFGTGRHHNFPKLYKEHLRPNLPVYAQDYWDTHLHYFNGRGIRKTFYHYGTSGTFAWMASQYVKANRKLYKRIQQLFAAENLQEQAQYYYELEERMLNNMVEWLVNRHLALCLVGVPRSQQELFVNKYERGALGFIQECLRKVFTERPIQDNYFWRLYMYGAYTKECCPSYLEEDKFELIKRKADNVHVHNNTIAGFLKENPGKYSHFILLDHQDWLAANDHDALEEEWRLILDNSQPGTRILLRSAASVVDFFPDFVLDAVEFEQKKTKSTHEQDRVGTYASVYMLIVK